MFKGVTHSSIQKAEKQIGETQEARAKGDNSDIFCQYISFVLHPFPKSKEDIKTLLCEYEYSK